MKNGEAAVSSSLSFSGWLRICVVHPSDWLDGTLEEEYRYVPARIATTKMTRNKALNGGRFSALQRQPLWVSRFILNYCFALNYCLNNDNRQRML